MKKNNFVRKGNVPIICFVTKTRIGETLGGVERNIWDMINWLNKEKISYLLVFRSLRRIVDQISPQDERKLTSSSKMGLGLRHGTFILSEVSLFLWSLLATLKILSINKRCKFSIIHCFSYSLDGLAALIAGALLKIPYTVHVKGPGLHIRYLTHDIGRKISWTLEFPLHLLVLKRAGLVLCESMEGASSLAPYIDKSKIALSTSFIEIKKYRLPRRVRYLVRKELNIPENAIVIGYVGRLESEKNVESLIRAYGRMHKLKKFPSKLLVIGSGSLENQLKELIRKSDIFDEVLFLGRRSDVNLLLQAMDVFVLPSFYEGYSTALLEAMAAGKAIIASNIPSNKEILGNDGGLFIDPMDNENLCSSMLTLCDDPDIRVKMQSKASLLAEQYDIDNVCKDFLQKILKVANSDLEGIAPYRS